MNTDTITTISTAIIAVAGIIAGFFPAEVGPVITSVAKGVAIIFVAIAGYFMNKRGTLSLSGFKREQ
jgi:hypothetical protein